MRKLYINWALFIIPILALLTLFPIDQRSKFRELSNDCFHQSSWLYDRIVHNKKPVDVVFIGSSHTLNSINDELITSKLKNLICTNIGYCRLGIDLNYSFAKLIIQHKKPKHIVLEIRESEDRYSHPTFPHLAENKDVLLPSIFFNKDIISNIWTHYSYNLEVSQSRIFKNTTISPFWETNFGFASQNDTITKEIISKLKIQEKVEPNNIFSFEEKFHLTFHRSYVKKIAELCKHNNIQLHFLYIPTYGNIDNMPNDYFNYLKYGEVILPPNSIFKNSNNWHDESHLNTTGANQLSLWLSTYMRTWVK
ncbi:hypothetical protein [uncultured Cytophaga sp.]|uniref:hypothetical protein n=1 Tax=uncultured Cytophaga sp. TaxID=160238 RepID=UPI00261FF13D|nr:hypothetical protein [uncultured Cytophaga sp.]